MTNFKKARKWTPLGIAAMVLGFIVWWPLGLAAIAYILWGDQLRYEWDRKTYRAPDGARGNAAFDAYRRETLNRLDDEKQAFTEYVERLREVRDRDEFDRFMKQHRSLRD